MKEVLKLAKYTGRSLKIVYLINTIILVIGIFGSLGIRNLIRVFGGVGKSGGIELIPVVAIIATVNFVAQIIIFSMQISKEHGRLLFQTPIKGIQLILANISLLIVVDITFIVMALLFNLVLAGSINSWVIFTLFAIVYGTVSFTFVIISFIGICSSLIKNTALCVIVVAVSASVAMSLYGVITYLLLYFVPYVYISIGGVSIDIIKGVIDILALVLVGIYAGNTIDNKVDII